MAGKLDGKVAWVTGAGSGIGRAAALALATEGAQVALTGRRPDALDETAALLERSDDILIVPGDLTQPMVAGDIVQAILARFGRLDILVNNAGGNIRERSFAQLEPAGIDGVIQANLNGAFYCTVAALKPMREQRDGLLIHTASWAGKHVSAVSGSAYSAAKAAVVTMSHGVNLEEYNNGIRSTVIMPAEVSTPILEKRPQPPSTEVRATMLQPSDMGELIAFVATRPASVCLNEVVISPTANRMFSL